MHGYGIIDKRMKGVRRSVRLLVNVTHVTSGRNAAEEEEKGRLETGLHPLAIRCILHRSPKNVTFKNSSSMRKVLSTPAQKAAG
jgi:hypothetical protein